MPKRIFVIRDGSTRQRAANAVLDAPEEYSVVISPKTRSLEQNAKLHALFGEASRNATWSGRKLSLEQWKVLFISGHAIATGSGADVVAGLEGEFVNIRESSAGMTIGRMNSLIEYINAWLAENVEEKK